MIRRILTRIALEHFARRGFHILTREQVYGLVRTGDRAQRIADELLRRAEAAEAKVEAYEAEAVERIELESKQATWDRARANGMPPSGRFA